MHGELREMTSLGNTVKVQCHDDLSGTRDIERPPGEEMKCKLDSLSAQCVLTPACPSSPLLLGWHLCRIRPLELVLK